jgi:hypothetical protein
MLVIMSTAITQIDVGVMRTFLYIFAICVAVLLLFVTVDRVERRPLAILLMIVILGIVAVAVLIKVMP